MSSSAIQGTSFGVATESQRGVVNGTDARNLVFGGYAMSFRNKIINGNFDVWQRGTSQTSSGYGSDDRWANSHSGSTKTHSQQAFTLGQTDVSGNPKFFSRTVVSSVAGAGNFVIKAQKIESVAVFAGQNATLSFWAKADSAKNIAVEFAQSFGTGGSPSAQVTSIGVTTIALTTSWQKFTVTVAIPSISGKTLGTNNDDCFELWFWLDAGSNFNARTNSLGQRSGTYDIAQVQLEAGSVATPFENRPIGVEEILCKRYCHVAKADTIYAPFASGLVTSATTTNILYPFPVSMRAAPTTITPSGSFQISDGVGSSAVSAITSSGTQVSTMTAMLFATSTGLTTYRPVRLESANNTTAQIIFSAEL